MDSFLKTTLVKILIDLNKFWRSKWQKSNKIENNEK